MPSRVVSIDTGDIAVMFNGKDAVLVTPGNRCLQITPHTLPSTAIGLVGIRAGKAGDPVRLNNQGVIYQLSGKDIEGGLFLVWMGTSILAPSGVAEFTLSPPDGEG